MFFSMELPVSRWLLGSSNGRKTRYKIETRKLSYKLCTHYDYMNWVCTHSKRDLQFILKDVHCEANAGEITAIAGPSGAGKTTLLEIMGGKISSQTNDMLSGQVLVNDRRMDPKSFQRISGYVTQDDALFPLLTVEETLTYSALLRLNNSNGHKVVACRVRELMKELALEHIASSRIGGPGSNCRGISGGERRRVSIGVELVHNPDVILIDEPTSGLDSTSALHLIQVLKKMILTDQGKTILLTIHQPSFRILELFDRIVLLSNGFVMHNGSLNLLEERLKLFDHQIPHHVNVLEFSIDVVESMAILYSSESFHKLHFLKDHRPENCIEEKKPFVYSNTWFKEVIILVERFRRNIFRTKQLFVARVVQALVAGLILGSIFLDVGNENRHASLQTRLGFFAFSLTFLLSSTTEGLPIFLQERRILMRETSRGAYRVSSYVLANTLIFIPFLLMISLLFATPVYWLVGLKRDILGFSYFTLVVWMVVLMSNSFVACFSALVPNFIMGTSVISGLMGSFFLFSGYFIPKKSIPNYWIFMHYLSLFKYPFECFMINEYGGDEKGKGRCIDFNGGERGGYCRVFEGDFLRQQGLKESQKWSNLAVMLGFIVGYRAVSFLILWYRCCRTRN